MWGPEAAQRLGAVVRARRRELGLTQEALALQVGITKNQLQLIEVGRSASSRETSGPSNPRMTTLAGIAATLDISVAQMMTESDI